MLVRGLAVALLATLLAAAPAQAAPPDAFCVILIEALDGMQGVRVLVDEETTLEERAALFPQVDLDGDGQVTRAEGDAWRRANLSLHNGTAGVEPRQALRLRPTDTDGAGEPLYTAITRQVGHTFHKQDHVQPWPVTQSADLETQAFREFSYPLVEGARRFELRGGPAAPPPTSTSTTTTTQGYTVTPEYVVLRAPEGWLVERVQGSDYSGSIDLRPNAREVDLPAFDTKSSPFTVTYVRASAAGTSSTTTSPPTTVSPSPAGDGSYTIPGPALPLAALAVGALALRRRLA